MDGYFTLIICGLSGERNKRLIYASIKSVIDPEWDEILSRDTSIQEKNFDQIFTLMLQSYLDRNPLIIQRLTALRITRAKEELVSDWRSTSSNSVCSR